MLLKPPPQARPTELFTSMPDEFRRKNTLSSWAKANRLGVPGESMLEGPVFDTEGNLFVTDIEFGRIFRIDPQGSWSLVIEYHGEPNGMKFLSRNELLVTDYRNGLVVIDLKSGTHHPFLDRRNSERFKGVNDLTFDSKGNLYFTDQGQTGLHDPTGRVYRLHTDGRLDLLLHNVPSPNGLVLSLNENILYVAATRGNSVWRVPLMQDGGVSKVGQYFTSCGPAGPDGLAIDAAGNLVVANPGLGVVWVLDSKAQPIDLVASCAGVALTNIAFGGTKGDLLYCTESDTGSILRVQMAQPGAKVHGGRTESAAN